MDTIRLTGVQAMGTHGVLDYEHQRAQPFIVDATLSLDLARAGRSDDLRDTVDYGKAAKLIVSVIEGGHVDLIERLAARIADVILTELTPVRSVVVTVHKPKAPITVPFADVSVTIERDRCSLSPAPNGGNRASGTISDPVMAQGTIHHAVVALGGNQGDVAATLRAAVADIDGLDGTQVTGVSPLYRTAAWGMPDGTPDFLNAVLELDTMLDAGRLLDELQRIEAAHGRTREQHWSSRTLDLDIIDIDGTVSDNPGLTLPHPRAWQRAFVLAPWLALDPDAELTGKHGGAVSRLLQSAGDRDDVHLVGENWMTGKTDLAGTAADAAHAQTGTAATQPGAVTQPAAARADASQSAEPDHTPGDAAAQAFHTAVISMDSTSTNAETLFRTAIVSLEGIPGNQVEGISPLYHVGMLEGPDAMAAVVQLTCRMDARTLIATLGTIEESLDGAVDLDLVDMPGVTCDEPDCRVPWPSARHRAAVLAPWMDMDPDARLGNDPVSYLLAMADDADRVGLLSDTWIVGGAE
ncbi:2-amino-4-hydroxy-6-hydroxymethyldihydropteridine diphosphokinase [Bifidobacterium leontopitheci]|uniref:Bifunctional folate synthesis protein n=1 Tax=Bifidobacterium leontopitheci TaxID=2650774 RepID=A0A6I1GG26_9BIFI|nr:2-amino-4-hydroxy-6-hydroxymethyldihydropteridine diphosphokinase [Bifidobacterium leontopitheci]KAB7790593.1 2-amino-4-hydroxy-6- hydroxymethyldihydropteridin e pyrophosphokinase [Bifidobacterium leontopitheci]